MELKIKIVKNADFPNDETRPANFCAIVKSYSEAVKVVQEQITKRNLGGGNFAGATVTRGHKVIANISYNGRLWTVDGNPM